MVDLAETDSAAPNEQTPRAARHSRRLWIVLGVVAVLVAAATTLTAVSFRYLHAAALTTDGGGWIPPDNKHLLQVQAGQYSASIARPRPGHAQTFEIELNNFSPVSQTVLGLTDGKELGNARKHAEPVHLTVSANSEWPHTGPLHFTTAPVTLAPKSTYVARFTIDTGHIWKGCRSEYWNSLSLQVRVGIFTRTETVDFDDLIMELRSGGNGCWS